MEPVGATVLQAQNLLQTVTRAITWWNQTVNDEVAEELSLFAKNLKHNIIVLSWRKVAKNTTSIYAIEALQKDLQQGQRDAERILMENVVESLWNAEQTFSELLRVHHRVITSFQIYLLFTIMDVALDLKNMQRFEAAMVRVQSDIAKAYSATNPYMRKELKAQMRKDIRDMFILLLLETTLHGQSIEEVISIIKGNEQEAQTDDLEKIFSDLVAAAHEKSLGSRADKKLVVSTLGHCKSTSDGLKWYHDPITWEIMSDPVKASDRRTYDRWTLIYHAREMQLSPFDKTPHLQIVFDDIDVRSRLFQKFPEQEQMFYQLRHKYRQEALEKANDYWCDQSEVLVMLDHVLAWSEKDEECLEKRKEILMRMNEEMVEEMGIDIPTYSSSSSSSESFMAVASPNSRVDTTALPELMSRLDRGYKAFWEGDYSEAANSFTAAISLAPRSESLYSKRSASRALLHRYDEALTDATVALALKPNWAEGYLRLAIAYQGMKRYREALGAYRKGLEADPNNEEILASLAELHVARRKERGYRLLISSQKSLVYLVLSFATLQLLRRKYLHR
ncbi:hypothetical protein R1flu_009344 [Riccia fluitans]|uniref:U-box domain-containing protein n=1 Tax=Riccia fluitans TaxID=41844 RepID=A0ABD1Z1T8_9MARC